MSFSVTQSNITSSGNIIGVSIMGNGLTITSMNGKSIRRSGKSIIIDDDSPEVNIKANHKAEEEDDVHVKGNHINVNIERIVGYVIVEGAVEYQLRVESTNGNIELNVDVGTDMHVDGTNCDITLRGKHLIKGYANISTVNGNIGVQQGTDFDGRFKANSVNGNIRISHSATFNNPDAVQMRTVNGNIKVPESLMMTGARLKTVNGSVGYY